MADFSYNTQNQPEDHQTQGIDYFDLLPDPILNLIFNKLFDAKSLCCCLLVSKRFASLVSEVDSISIIINNNNNNNQMKPKKPLEHASKTSSGSKSFLKNPIFKFICKPFNLLQQATSSKKVSKNESGVDIQRWVGNTLKNFNDVQSIKLELPCHGGEIGINKNIPLLKWEAEFGKEMERCAILGATAIVDRQEKKGSGIEEGGSENEVQVFSDDELKLRIIWIISCLIASSARHNLVKKMVGQCPKLSDAVVSDAGKQGKLSMNAGQIKDLRDSINIATDNVNKDEKSEAEPHSETAAAETTTAMAYAGNLVMKLWYVKELELPNSRKVMKGATLVVIKPEKKVAGEDKGKEKGKEGDGLSMWKAFEGEEIFEEAARKLLRGKERRMYRLEMNSF